MMNNTLGNMDNNIRRNPTSQKDNNPGNPTHTQTRKILGSYL